MEICWFIDMFDIFLSLLCCFPAPKKVTKEVEKIDNFFASYANTETGLIDPEGVEKLCSDLKVEHTDVRILMLAWKMNAKTQGYFTQVCHRCVLLI
ncbi:Defective-in-cullin neddylation protein [Artemisia annua]|uniref:Defective in cullin neddylation protein n=1 Tax=Artemisia annua TaxID=35608 RepID=A0A2U1M5P7_ARTAN|nr:Defective-in-cullin neddylation protein [Artemisia annua]